MNHLDALSALLGTAVAFMFAVYIDEPMLAAASAFGVCYVIDDFVGGSWPLVSFQQRWCPNVPTNVLAGCVGVFFVACSRFVIGEL